ncbi:DNA-binding protein [Streptomyces sp. WM6373]|nr:DNA-binding protein [Streptomyces sp. WM6373]KOU75318.1 DNA-binding protein [Streptomyces sp. XY66]KOU76654.1 DNA-binding protein [Streptomyces sp. IGB124]KOU98581.1 DNA-binding protein [Streptomyces sp. XY58]KOV07767.1 DNA-binding protein [Streptomyces sp. XY37]KOV22776.1 DNA-binding protein [Streptomyces sp. XY413]KOV43187.1 DNA-binding protein [Streptomyces sp. MMG1064]KOV49106.1 DNA-binding protein [Streptomyces sp. H021]
MRPRSVRCSRGSHQRRGVVRVDAVQQEATARARELQRSWYGEPLGALFRRLIDDLGLNQARLAAVLGLSAPMLSQLMSGQRAKIGNPAVVQRVQALQDLAGQVADGSVSAAEATDRMDEIKKTQGGSVLSSSGQTTTGSGAPTVKRVVREIQSLLRSVSAAGDIIDAANSLAPSHPELAEFLRVYGAGRTADAVAHYEAHQN